MVINSTVGSFNFATVRGSVVARQKPQLTLPLPALGLLLLHSRSERCALPQERQEFTSFPPFTIDKLRFAWARGFPIRLGAGVSMRSILACALSCAATMQASAHIQTVIS